MAKSLALSRDILTYWFQGLKPNTAVPGTLMKQWFNGGSTVDKYISTHFKLAVTEIHAGQHDTLIQSPEGVLSLIVALDQFPRNIYRNTANMFAYDAHALALAKQAVADQFDQQLMPVYRSFLYLPYEHSEELSDQNTSVMLYERLLSELTTESPEYSSAEAWLQYAKDHRDIIQQFGRFPHRNHLLQRSTTSAEKEYLATLGDNLFGVDKK